MQNSGETGDASPNSATVRILFETTVQYHQHQESAISGLCCDLSVGGLYLRTQRPLAQDETVTLSFSIPGQEQDMSITCKARVAWTNFERNRRKPTYPSGAGLQFLALSHDVRTTLAGFIADYDEHKKMTVRCAWCGRSLGLRKGPMGTTSHGICSHCRNHLDTVPCH